jgi:hypothetical protein
MHCVPCTIQVLHQDYFSLLLTKWMNIVSPSSGRQPRGDVWCKGDIELRSIQCFTSKLNDLQSDLGKNYGGHCSTSPWRVLNRKHFTNIYHTCPNLSTLKSKSYPMSSWLHWSVFTEKLLIGRLIRIAPRPLWNPKIHCRVHTAHQCSRYSESDERSPQIV